MRRNLHIPHKDRIAEHLRIGDLSDRQIAAAEQCTYTTVARIRHNIELFNYYSAPKPGNKPGRRFTISPPAYTGLTGFIESKL